MSDPMRKEGEDLSGWRLRTGGGEGKAQSWSLRCGSQIQRLRRVLRRALWFSRHPRREGE